MRYFPLWIVLHTVSFALFAIWIIPSFIVTMTWGIYRNWSIYAPDWSMPWGLAAPYAKWVNRITKAKVSDE